MQDQSFIQADIFFFVSTIALVIISIGIVVALFYLIKVLRNAREISEVVKEEGKAIISDVRRARFTLHAEGSKWGGFLSSIRDFISRKTSYDNEKKTKTSRKSKKTTV